MINIQFSACVVLILARSISTVLGWCFVFTDLVVGKISSRGRVKQVCPLLWLLFGLSGNRDRVEGVKTNL
jgi:hypothetical protein